MGLSRTAAADRIKVFEKDLDRARTLYDRLVENGYSGAGLNKLARLRQPDRRDIAQFIFFEVAARFEDLIRDLFLIEVRKRLCDSPKRAAYIMGHSDYGLGSVHGWGDIRRVQKRAENLFGKAGFFARIEEHVGDQSYRYLPLAHILRNRIAHPGRTTAGKFRGALGSLRIPRESRRGASVGRVLVDYPMSAGRNDRWFHRFLDAYEEFSIEASAKL